MNEIDERLHAYLDGESSPEAARALEAELAKNQALAAQLAELRSLYASLDGLDEEPLSRDLRPGVLAALRGAQVARPWPAWLLPAEGALAALLLALAGSYLGRLLPVLPDPGASLQAGFADLLIGLQTVLGQTQAALTGLANRDLAALPTLPSTALSTVSLLALAAGLLLLGLVGNSLLLRDHQRP